MWWWTFRFHKIRVISWVVHGLLASQEGLYSMELVRHVTCLQHTVYWVVWPRIRVVWTSSQRTRNICQRHPSTNVYQVSQSWEHNHNCYLASLNNGTITGKLSYIQAVGTASRDTSTSAGSEDAILRTFAHLKAIWTALSVVLRFIIRPFFTVM
jgi:hypothetical protein